jgi:multidrug efflux system outer membrane protein
MNLHVAPSLLRRFREPRRGALPLLALFLTSGCVVGPDYERPVVQMPEQWRWKVAEPKDDAPRGDWWTVFNEPELNGLQAEARDGNLDLQAAFHRVDQARAVARVSRAEFFPTLDAAADWSRYRTSGNSPSPVPFPIPSFTQEQWRAGLDLSYELDLWGRVRRSFESARYLAMSAQAAYQSVLLSLQADVAANYFSLKGAELQIKVLEQTLDIRTNAFEAIEQRVNAGFGTEFEIQRAKVEVAAAEAALQVALRRRAELANALAVLCGIPAPSFDAQVSLEVRPLPTVAPNLPSTLLERRPDVAEAERQLAARNADIGVAKAAFFPVVSLTAAGGYLSGDVSDLFLWDSRTWLINPTISLPIFAGGRNKANLERSRAAYEESVAIYRQRVLVAFQEVEDSLAALRFLASEVTALETAMVAARNAASISFDRYRAGAINFIELVDAEARRLEAELALVRSATEQRLAMVRLLKALGGGWPSDEEAEQASSHEPSAPATEDKG